MSTIRMAHVPADRTRAPQWVNVNRDDFRAQAAAIGAEWIEIVRGPHGVIMIVDEEGHLKRRKVNDRVSGILYPGPIAGDVLICCSIDGPEGRDVANLTPKALVHLRFVGLLPEEVEE